MTSPQPQEFRMKRKSLLIDLVVSSLTYIVCHKTLEHFDKKKRNSSN